ncbi:MAG: EAL domain-containing protein [Alphaproteobacteria bacterium]|nr:EAL domain-containing protein [Alphaproteobacteria bacterium]
MASGRNDHTQVWLCFGSGFALSAAAFAFSPEASLILFFMTLFSGLWLTENKRRFNWEKIYTFKIRKLEKDGKSFAETLERYDTALNILKKDISALKQENSALQPIPLSKPLNTKPVLRAIKPAHKRRYNDLFNSPAPAANTNPSPVSEDSGYSDIVIAELLDHAISTNSIEVFVQPIVRLPTRQIRYFEMFARLRAKPGTYIPARRFGAHGKLLDRLMLVRCLDLIKSAPRSDLPPFFLNIAGETLKDAGFMRSLLPFASQNRDLISRVIFEIPYDAFRALDSGSRKVMEGLARLGCSFSLDNINVPPPALNIEEFMHYRIKAVKMSASLFKNKSDAAPLTRLKSRLEGNGIAVILSGIESEAQLRQLLPFGPNNGQGYLFGRPDLKGAYIPNYKTNRA